MVAPSIELLVRQRANRRCEYYQLPESGIARPFQIDHIRAKQHVLDDSPENLALACHRCNSHKEPNLAGIDPVTGLLVPLFNPRAQQWADHFAWQGARVPGVTDVGRVSIHVLNMNAKHALRLRMVLIKKKTFF